MPLISIIIPVYNVEPYLRRCLDSVLAQTFTDWECVIVDDGSPDGCPAICDEYVARDRRFRVLHQENAGTAHARDAGIRCAEGEFVTFVDSDDFVEPDMAALLVRRQRETGADIVLGSYRVIYPFGVREYIQRDITREDDVLEHYFLTNNSGMPYKLYRRRLFENYVVPDTNIGEDDRVNTQIFSKVSRGKAAALNDCIYNYDQTSNGVTTRQFKRQTYGSINEFPAFQSQQWIGEYLDRVAASPRVISAWRYHAIVLVIAVFLLSTKTVTTRDIRFLYKNYFRPCAHKKLLRHRDRLLFYAFHWAGLLGYAYRFVLKKLALIKHRR